LDILGAAFFALLTIGTIGAGVGVVLANRITTSALLMAFTFLNVAGMFVLLGAETIAMFQVLIYVGAITVLILYGVMFTPQSPRPYGLFFQTQKLWAALFVVPIVYVLMDRLCVKFTGHSSAHGLIRAAEIEFEPAFRNGEREADTALFAFRVAIEKIFRDVASGRQALDRRAKALLREIEVAGDRGFRLLHAVTLEELQDAAGTDGVRGELRLQVAHPLAGRARVEQDQVEHVPVELARAHDAHRRDAHAFLVDRLAHRGFRARHHAAHIRVMRDVGDEGDDAPADEDRRDDGDVGQVRAAAVVRIVRDEHIARHDLLLRKALQYLVHRAHHRAQVYRHALRQRDHLPRGVEYRGRAVRAFLDVGRERGAHERRTHFLRRREEKTGDDLGPDRVYASAHCRVRFCAAGASSMCR